MARRFWVYQLSIVSLMLSAWLLGVPSVSIAGESPRFVDPQAGSVEECYALDIVFLIDQSTSMGGDRETAPNDPTDQRVEAARWVLNRLGYDRLFLCPAAVHRMGVISFGGDREPSTIVDLELAETEIDPDPAAELDVWQRRREGLKQEIEARDLDSTDIKSAFAEAKRMFDDALPLEGVPRRRAIILLSDGQPCVRGLGCVYGEYTFPVARYMDEMKDQIERDLPFDRDAPQESTYIWLVALNVARPMPSYVANTWEEIVGSHGGAVIPLSANRADIPDAFYRILRELAPWGPGAWEIKCGPVYVDPYLESATFHLFRDDESLRVSIEYEIDGQTLLVQGGEGDVAAMGLQDYAADGPNEMYHFRRPEPGLWTVTSDNCERFVAWFEPLFVESYLTEPQEPLPLYDDPGSNHDPYDPHYLSYRVVEKKTGDPFPEHADYPLSIQSVITAPDGSTSLLELYQESDGVFVSSEPLPVSQVGEYTFETRGTSHGTDPSKSDLLVILEDQGSYDVFATVPVELVIEQPAQDETLPLHGGLLGEQLTLRSVQTRVYLADRAGNRLNPTTVLEGDLDQAFVATVSSGGKQESINLLQDSEAPDYFIGHSTKLDSEGLYELTVELVGDHDPHYRLVAPTAQVAFWRVDSLWTRPITYQSMLALTLALLASLLGLFIYMRTSPVRGYLVFERIGVAEEVARIPLSRGRRRVRIGSRELATRHPMVPFARIQIHNAPGEAKATRCIKLAARYAENGEIEEILTADGTGVHISFDMMMYYRYQE
jgi:hypothetical protein